MSQELAFMQSTWFQLPCAERQRAHTRTMPWILPSWEGLSRWLDAEEERSVCFPKLSVCKLFLSINLPPSLDFVSSGHSEEGKEG